MPDIPRLNGVIKALQSGETAFVAFTPVDIESAVAMGGSKLDGVAFEMEHGPLDFPGLRQALQFMLDRRQIIERATLSPAVTPMVRVPPNGNEKNQWIAKQVLDIGVFGIIFPHVSTVEEAWNAVSACRYPRLATAPMYNPPGIRGDAPTRERGAPQPRLAGPVPNFVILRPPLGRGLPKFGAGGHGGRRAARISRD